MRRGWIVASVIAVASLVIVIGLIALVSGGDESVTGSQEAGPAGFPGGSQELQDCLEEQGIEGPQGAPSGGAPSAPDAGQAAAFEACREFLPEDPPSGGGFPAPPGG